MSSKHLHQNHNGNSRQTTTFRSDSRSISENVVEAWLDLSTVPPRKRKRTSSSRCTTPLTPEVPTPESTSSLPQSDPDPSDGRPCVSLPLTKATLEAMAAQQGTVSLWLSRTDFILTPSHVGFSFITSQDNCRRQTPRLDPGQVQRLKGH